MAKQFEYICRYSRDILKQSSKLNNKCVKIRTFLFDDDQRVDRFKLFRNVLASNYAFLYNEYDILSKHYRKLYEYTVELEEKIKQKGDGS
jgi:hypothetical protein